MNRTNQPRENEIDWGEPAPHPVDALSLATFEAALNESHGQTTTYREIAHALLDALHHVIAERDALRERLRERRQ